MLLLSEDHKVRQFYNLNSPFGAIIKPSYQTFKNNYFGGFLNWEFRNTKADGFI